MSRSGIGENPETFDRLDLFAGDTYSTQVHDLLDVVRYAQARYRGLPLFLLGHSRGGGIALLGARDRRPCRRRHLELDRTRRPLGRATKRKWRADGFLDVINARTKQVMPMSTAILDDYEAEQRRLDILDSATHLRVPLLAIHGAGDESVPLDESRQIVDRAGDASLLVIGGASHTYNAIHPLVHVPRALRFAAAVSAHFVARLRVVELWLAA